MPLPPNLREFDDSTTARQWMFDSALDAVKKRFPVEDKDYRLELNNVRYDGPQEYGINRQKQALIRDDYLKVPMKGTWRLVHKPSGQVLDEKDETVMHVPYLTDRGTMIYHGNEYSAVSQSRLKPGVYTRTRRSGELEAFYNVKTGTGPSFRVWMEPDTGVFRVNIRQSNIPLYPLLKTLGVSDKELMDSWGAEIVEANAKAKATGAVDKLYDRFAGRRADLLLDSGGKAAALGQLLSGFELDPDVVARTLGVQGINKVSPELLKRTTQKLLNISKGQEEPDDRDHPQFSHVLSVEDLVREPIDKDANKLTRTLMFKLRRDKNLHRLAPGTLNPYMDSFLLGSRLTMPLEETNPMHLLEQQHRITKLGEGGISNAESITDEARDVNIGQLGFVDPITGPEGMNIGIDVRAAFKTFKGKDRQMYGEFTDPRTGDTKYLKPEDVVDKVLAFPGQMARKGDSAVAVVRGKIQTVPKEQVDLEVPSFAHMMSPHTNLNPMPTGYQAARLFYGAKYWSQYMPQVKGEAPLVDSLVPGSDETFSAHYGRRVGTIRAKKPGVVTKVVDDEVTVMDDEGRRQKYELVKDFPFNRLTGISYYPSVKPGDQVDEGSVLAHSNFTNSKGELALGRNLRVAVVPYRGLSYEDAYVISDKAAKDLSTQRLYGFDQEARHGVELGKNKYMSLFPDQFNKDQLEKLDDEGIAKPGMTLQKGDPIIAAVGPKLLSAADIQLGKLHKALRQAHTDKAVVWEHDYPGRVVDAARTRTGAKVNIVADVPVNVGDKLANRYGIKGVVGHILPDAEMPRDPVTNEPYDLLVNPMTILSRVAPAALLELQLAKIAKKTGKQITLPQEPPEEGWAAWTQKQLDAAGLKDTEPIFDPTLKRNLNPVMTGLQYFAAFHHLSEKKLSERGASGFGYTADELPARGGSETAKSKKMSQMDVTQLLAHGATEVARDAQVIRGARNDEYWKAMKLGRPLPEPSVPFVYEKFINLLKAGGINLNQKGDTLSLLPMTDDDISALSRGEVASGAMVDDNFDAIPGGLFDLGKTGGLIGKHWSHVNLVEPVPNPVFEEPIRRLLGLRQKDLTDIIAGRQELNGLTGGKAIKEALSGLDIDAEIARHKLNAMKYRGSQRDNAIKSLGYLLATKKQGLHPQQWVISKVPVLPPVFRPVAQLGDITLQADINELYRDLIESNNVVKELRTNLRDKDIADERQTLYEAVKASFGLGEPITPEGRSRRLRGALWQVTGDSPKTGLFQSRVASKPVDVVGRGVVSPDPNLDMDSIGIPEDSAWTLYKDFVLRKLVRQNIPAHRALEMIDNRDPQAKAALMDEMTIRPVIVDRAPTWHRFNLLGFYPHIVKGNTVRVSPLITKGFTMDFDGDAVNFHVPVSEEARKQTIEKMLPSKNLFSLTDLRSVRHSPQQELALGLYLMTAPSKKPVRRFANAAAAKKAYNEGIIDANDPIELG